MSVGGNRNVPVPGPTVALSPSAVAFGADQASAPLRPASEKQRARAETFGTNPADGGSFQKRFWCFSLRRKTGSARSAAACPHAQESGESYREN